MRNKILEAIKGATDGYLTPAECADIIESIYREQHGVDLMELGRRREQILDINQWAGLLINSGNVAELRPRIVRGMIGDILNRTTD